jgi:nucleoside triphosphate diphosphatase
MDDQKSREELKQSPIQRLLEIMARLRDPNTGCPWDRQQNFATIAPYTIEEAYEVADAIERKDPIALLDELGDLLFQIVFYAQMATEDGTFNFDDVARTISDKMIRRHPHVFASQENLEPETQYQSWEKLKAAERQARAAGSEQVASALDGVADALPALMRAEKLQKRAARVGFDWPDIAPVFDKINEELEEVQAAMSDAAAGSKIKEEVGDLLFSVVNLARHLGIDPEDALRDGNKKFDRRFRAIETRLADDGRTPTEASPEELERHWLVVKKQETGAS